MTTGLERITVKACNEKKLCFTSLAHHINLELLWECLRTLPTMSAQGTDGVDVNTAKETFMQWAPAMLDDIHQRRYKPPAVKRVYIPKPGKSTPRPIGVPTVIDRVLQKAVSKLLEPIYEQDFLNSSFGGRPKRNAHQALATLNHAVSRNKVNFILEADLKSFFDSLNHGWVEQFFALRVADPRITTLIKRWLKAGVMEEGQYRKTEQGTPQGGPISVLISNLYLHYALDLWIEKVVKPRMKGELHYIRYLDDFVLCFQNQQDARKVQGTLAKRLHKFDLTLEASKTQLVRFGRFAQQDAKQLGEKLKPLCFLGFTLYCSRNRWGKFKLGFKTEKGRLKRAFAKLKLLMRKIRHQPLREQQRAINRVLTGHYNYYGISDNYTAIKNLYHHAIKYWRKCLSSRSQRGKVTWEKYRQILKILPLREPKIKLSYRRLEYMALLAKL